ncbi:SMP-30/gluconolactonase/LRE family protein [Pigmentiphaga sp. H8]|uniref:SMP-30/gluconolactonase/LRE family protein n=1 Tax=Pigmentiphaga sp. H8 TaxID=2488560 RepID=UPI001375D01E|nr:SMP-30/gluconolactonase/LRE family protein [Pigmentiphaga sp. H8]
MGESPLWCPVEQVLWWLDIGNPTLWRLDRNGTVDNWRLPKPAGCLTLLREGGLALAFRSGLATLDTPGGTPQWRVPDGLALGEDRFNDGKCDRAGRFWVGTMDRRMRDPVGALYRFDGIGRCTRMASGFVLSNGVGWSPDDRTLYFADTALLRIHAFDYDLAGGSLARPRTLHQFAPGPGGPDGLTVDQDGGIWVALFGRGCLHRYDPHGRLDYVIELPVSQPTSVMFGGDSLDILYVTSATVGLDAAALAREPLAGSLLTVRPGIRGLSEPRFVSTPGQGSDSHG